MTEEQLKAAVLELATMYGWKVFSVTNSTRLIKKGAGFIRVKNINPQGNGYPDLTLARQGRILFVELKQDGRYPEPEQREWLDALAVGGPVQTFVWKPKDLESGAIAANLA